MTPPGTGRPPAASAADSHLPHVLREYAVLADGRRGAVVGPRGEVAWLGFPDWDSPTIFDGLAGGASCYDVHPDEPYVWGGYYEDGTLIWRDRWVTQSGAVVECRTALQYPGEADRVVVLRRLTVVSGAAAIRAVLHPRADYGEKTFRDWQREDGGGWSARCGSLALRWTGRLAEAARPSGRPRSFSGAVTLTAGESSDLVLEVRQRSAASSATDVDERWRATEGAWQATVPEYSATAAPREARFAHAVLAGMTAPSGGTVAAITTSLPERAEQGRNYDYRYVWIRDQCFVGHAAAVAGEGLDLLDGSVRFVCDRLFEHGSRLVPAYTSSGGEVPSERPIPLPGYPGGNAVSGNHAAAQFQLDAFGEILVMLAAAARRDRLDGEGWRAAELAVGAISDRWTEADAGIWELGNDHWTHSRLSCVAGIRSICAAGAPARSIGPWEALADAILAETGAQAVHPSGRWQRSATDERVDAALLVPLLQGATPLDDPRTRCTFDAVSRDLMAGGHVYRFRPDDRPLGEAEGAFQLCIFVHSLMAAALGQMVDAARLFERGRAACGPAGLFTEEFDTRQRQLRGNLPQAFVHALLLETAAVLGKEIGSPDRL